MGLRRSQRANRRRVAAPIGASPSRTPRAVVRSSRTPTRTVIPRKRIIEPVAEVVTIPKTAARVRKAAFAASADDCEHTAHGGDRVIVSAATAKRVAARLAIEVTRDLRRAPIHSVPPRADGRQDARSARPAIPSNATRQSDGDSQRLNSIGKRGASSAGSGSAKSIRSALSTRRRRIVSFSPGSIFAFVRWAANEHGTIASRIDILRAADPDKPISTVPGVRPGGRSCSGSRAGPRSTRVESDRRRRGHWRRSEGCVAGSLSHVHNRISAGEIPRAYNRDHHYAWLLRGRSKDERAEFALEMTLAAVIMTIAPAALIAKSISSGTLRRARQ